MDLVIEQRFGIWRKGHGFKVMDNRDGMAALVNGYRILHLAQGSGLVSKVMFLVSENVFTWFVCKM
jgi:hypothetical protein